MKILKITTPAQTLQLPGEVNLFYGDEIQLAQSSLLTTLNDLVTQRLDAAISSRLSSSADTKLDQIKKNTDLIPAIL